MKKNQKTFSGSSGSGRADRSPCRGVPFLIALVWLMFAAGSVAGVRLQTTIAKVESRTDAFGEVEYQLVDASSVVPGDELRYTIAFTNEGTQAAYADSIVITNPLPDGTAYIEGTAAGEHTITQYSVDGENFSMPEALTILEQGRVVIAPAERYTAIRWLFEPSLAPGESSSVFFHVRLEALPGGRRD